MKTPSKLNLLELAGFVCDGLRKQGIDVVLSGGACVSIYSENQYESYDLDFIRIDFASFDSISEAMKKLGFLKSGRHFKHPSSLFFVEFPAPPLTVGSEPVKSVQIISVPKYGDLNIISATDCVKDRLCAYYFWKDKQGLDQAVLVASTNEIDLKEIRRWSDVERCSEKFLEFKRLLKKLKTK